MTVTANELKRLIRNLASKNKDIIYKQGYLDAIIEVAYIIGATKEITDYENQIQPLKKMNKGNLFHQVFGVERNG